MPGLNALMANGHRFVHLATLLNRRVHPCNGWAYFQRRAYIFFSLSSYPLVVVGLVD